MPITQSERVTIMTRKLNAEQYNEALEYYNDCVKDKKIVASENWIFHCAALCAIVLLKQWNKAWDVYCRAVKQKQFDEKIFQETAVCLCQLKDYKKASIVFFKSVELKQTTTVTFARALDAYVYAADSAKSKKEKAIIEAREEKFIKEAKKVAPEVVEKCFAATLAKQAREGIAA